MANTEILELVSTNKVFDGELRKYKFKASLSKTPTRRRLTMASATAHVPLLVYLAGLTCTEDNGAQKGGFFGPAAAKGIALLFPDTSPRGAGVEGEDTDWDFGVGAGFYLNATNPAFSKHYNMLTHVTLELPQVLGAAGLPIDLKRQSVFGHSIYERKVHSSIPSSFDLGGHGALTLYLASKTNQYRSVSAFSPICNPINCPWGQKAFKGYLQGGTTEAAEQYDATELIKKRTDPVRILIDYGTADNFYKQGQLLPENFVKAAREAGHDESQVQARSQDGYDHSYFFISTFATDHINFHAEFLL
ncbi:carbohydrate esterase family 1 protein [Mycena alexandri]|uniref:S-formylglutathione hydrolase n=1 Tax=Mycena alexandri TaxID=1745969 RepID=A0AAD6XBL6_9AGAR|nr:carbohydrate esterase family 1 protein [Mycena alexandri]